MEDAPQLGRRGAVGGGAPQPAQARRPVERERPWTQITHAHGPSSVSQSASLSTGGLLRCSPHAAGASIRGAVLSPCSTGARPAPAGGQRAPAARGP